MKTVTIPEKDYNRLVDENNSLRKLISGFVDSFGKLSEHSGGKSKSPKVSEAEKVSNMTPAQIKRYYAKKINSK